MTSSTLAHWKELKPCPIAGLRIHNVQFSSLVRISASKFITVSKGIVGYDTNKNEWYVESKAMLKDVSGWNAYSYDPITLLPKTKNI